MSQEFLTQEEIRGLLPVREQRAHKGSCGRVLIIAGSSQMMGAAILAAKAAFRSGVGYVYLATGSSYMARIVSEIPEIIGLPLTETDEGYGEMAQVELRQYLEETPFTSVVIGPGLGRTQTTQAFVAFALKECSDRGLAGVVDADAFLALSSDVFMSCPMNLYVLTPHPKEFELFSGLTYQESERVSLSEQFAQDIQQVLVLKGHHTVISYAGTAVLNPTGNPGMATAGSGDVLAGFIAGFIAQGLMTCDAAYVGVYLHGLAGDIAKESLGESSMMASDISESLSAAIQKVRHD